MKQKTLNIFFRLDLPEPIFGYYLGETQLIKENIVSEWWLLVEISTWPSKLKIEFFLLKNWKKIGYK